MKSFFAIALTLCVFVAIVHAEDPKEGGGDAKTTVQSLVTEIVKALKAILAAIVKALKDLGLDANGLLGPLKDVIPA